MVGKVFNSFEEFREHYLPKDKRTKEQENPYGNIDEEKRNKAREEGKQFARKSLERAFKKAPELTEILGRLELS